MSEENIDIYRELQKHLDKMPVGFPPTESGVEIRLLKWFFTKEEANIALNLSFMPVSLKKIHRKLKKTGITVEELENKLDEMYQKGLINYGKRIEGTKEAKYYANAPLVIGIFEYQLGRLTKDFITDFKKYCEEAFWDEFNKPLIPQLRTIPIEQSITHEQKISNYDELRNIIENTPGPIGVAECICRKITDLLGEPCKKTDMREICFTFRRAAEMYHDKGFARLISQEEALKILEKVQEAGLVLQPGNSQRPMCICCCCGCCCEVLNNQKRYDSPARFFATNYYAEVDEDLCVGCAVCEDRCNMEAISIIDDKSTVDRDRCIGCGVCVPTCVNDAISLKKKEVEIIPPKRTVDTYIAIMDKKAELARSGQS